MSDVKELRINNVTYDIKAKSVVDTNSGAVEFWTGTRAAYDALVSGGTTDANTVYVTDNGLFIGTTEVSNISSNRSISEIVISTVPLTDAGLHLLDGALIRGNGAYSAFVTKMSKLVPTYPNLFVTEEDWQTSVSTYGVCGKFVYTNEISATMPSFGTLTGVRNSSSDMDAGSLGMRYAWYVSELGGDIFTVSETPSVGDAIWVYQNGSWTNSGVNIETINRTVRLPKITGILEGTTDVTALGDLVEAGLPNITGNTSAYICEKSSTGASADASGAFTVTQLYTGKASSGNENKSYRISFDASRSSSIYGRSSTVQPQTIKCYYYIVIATSTKTDIQVNIDEVVTDLNSKADVDLSNMSASQSAKNEIISWGMPDYDNGIAIGSANKYEALVDGYYVGRATVVTGTNSTARIIVELYNNSNTLVFSIGNSGYDNNSGNTKYSAITLPVPKGYKITVTAANSLIISKFYPLKGAN